MRRIFTILFALLVGLSCTAANPLSKKDLGNVVTKQYNFKNFNGLQVSNAFEVELVKSDTYSVVVEINEVYEKDLRVSVTDNLLKIGLDKNFKNTVNHNGVRKVRITMPEVNRIGLSGASKLKSNTPFDCGMNRLLVTLSGASDAEIYINAVETVIEVSGASNLDFSGNSSETDVEVSGASKVKFQVYTSEMDIDVSGASKVTLSGSSDTLEADVSGASRLMAIDFPSDEVDLDCSGASKAEVNVNKKLDVDLSGASGCTYKSHNSLIITPDVKGASSLKRM